MRVREAGFVLLNALILVAALSAAAVALLRVSEDSRTGLALTRASDQARLYLDAAEPLALALLIREEDAVIDGLGQPWAAPQVFEIGDGKVAVRIADLQGRFNLNWLSRREDVSSFDAFSRLLEAEDLPGSLAAATRRFLTGAAEPAHAERPVPIRPLGRWFEFPEEWRQVEGVTPEVYAALAPRLATIPDPAPINVNTIPPATFAALFAPGRRSQIAAVFSRRTREPFGDVEEFIGRAVFHLGEELAEDIDPARLSVSSDWFEVTLSASLGTVTVQRRLTVTRAPDGSAARVIFRRADPG